MNEYLFKKKYIGRTHKNVKPIRRGPVERKKKLTKHKRELCSDAVDEGFRHLTEE